ncbi:MAG: Ig-like domain-containing protein [Verrucomicrobiota bacterium]
MKRSALALVVLEAPLANAQTVWTGPLTNYVQSQPYTPSDPNSEDQLTALVALTRASTEGLFNAVDESSFDKGPDTDPTDTEWAFGSIANYATLSYGSWDSVEHGPDGVGQQAVLHLITDDIYISIEFTAWGAQGAGGFSYTRSTPAAAAPPTPEVSLTNPTNGAAFTAPASVSITASASVGSGTVTNVAFFAGATSLGSAQSSPFTITAHNLAAGTYSLTAVATAAGVSATSAVVSITVNAPAPTVSITNPANGTIFAAPATVTIGASASVTGGTVTNVAFLTNGVLAGSATVTPFSVTLSGVHVASYALTAVATAAGVSATSAVVNISVVPPPSVAITNPAGGAVFAAPANVQITASASVVKGSVTNVSFFSGSTLLGSATVSPFAVTANNLSANSYALTAVATAAGLSTTSAVVNISVVNPVAVSNSVPSVANGQFTFSYNANPGLTYVVQKSSNLVSWVSLSTNVASGSPVQVTDAFVPTNSQYYRIGLAPNP